MANPSTGAGDFARLSGAMAVGFAGFTMLGPLVPLFASKLGATPVLVGMIVAAGSVLPLMLAVPLGSLVDRFGMRRVYLAGVAGAGLGPLLVVVWPSLLGLALTQVVAGMAQLVVVIAGQAAVAEYGDRGRRERRFGWFTAWLSAGQLIGPLLAGVLIEGVGFRATFAVSAAIALAMGAISLGIVFPASRERRADPGPTGLAHLRGMWGNAGIRFAILMTMLAVAGATVFQTFLPLHLTDLGFSAAVVGGVLSLRSVSSIVIRPLIPAIVRGVGGRFPALVAAVTTAGAAIAGLVVSDGIVWIAGMALIIGVGFGLSQPLSMIIVSDRALREELGWALGLRLSSNRLMHLVMPVLFGVAVQGLGFGFTFGIQGGAVVVLSLAALGLRRGYDSEERSAVAAGPRGSPGSNP